MGLIRVAAVLAFASFAARGFKNSPSFELEELSVLQLQDGMKSGKWSARQLWSST